MYEGQIILKGLRLCTGTSLLGKHMAAQQTKPPAAHWPLRKVWFREFPFIKVFPIGGWSFFCCRNCLHSVAVYSLGFPQWPVVILQVHITRMNRNWGPFLTQGVELPVVILDYDDYCKYFWNFRQWFVADPEGAVCLWQCCCLCHQPPLADQLQGDMWKCRPGFNCTLLWRRWLGTVESKPCGFLTRFCWPGSFAALPSLFGYTQRYIKYHLMLYSGRGCPKNYPCQPNNFCEAM